MANKVSLKVFNVANKDGNDVIHILQFDSLAAMKSEFAVLREEAESVFPIEEERNRFMTIFDTLESRVNDCVTGPVGVTLYGNEIDIFANAMYALALGIDARVKRLQSMHVDLLKKKREVNKVVLNDTTSARKKKSYFDWVDEYPEYVVLRREGYLWRAKEDCALVLSNALNYQLMERNNGIKEAGSWSIDRIQDELESRHINYVVIHFNELIDEQNFQDNQYKSYLY